MKAQDRTGKTAQVEDNSTRMIAELWMDGILILPDPFRSQLAGGKSTYACGETPDLTATGQAELSLRAIIR